MSAVADTPVPESAADVPCFMETQFPVSRLSKESYLERKSHVGQTITSLGKWWGRKPLVLCRAVILGLLMPASQDPKTDREIFLALIAMDNEAIWRRKNRQLSSRTIFQLLTRDERLHWFDDPNANASRLRRGLKKHERESLQRLAFNRLNYDDKLSYCARPEHIDGPSEAAWARINAHLGTDAESLPELVDQLGRRRFGHRPRVGDAFCGGGSVPFEAARIGCDAYGSDLNPVAALLTWGALNIIGGGEAVAERVRAVQRDVFAAVDRQISDWGIEHNAAGWRADAYLYCTEAVCPNTACGYRVPMVPSWVIGEKSMTVAELVPIADEKRFDIRIHQGVNKARLSAAKTAGTVSNSRLRCPACGESVAIPDLRGDRRGGEIGTRYGLRLWDNDDLVPRADDAFGERLYCIRWLEPKERPDGSIKTIKHYRAPDAADLERETRVLDLLRERFEDWQAQGYIPSRRIEPGDETTRLTRERGWTHWHHLFTPRQLLYHGLFTKTYDELSQANPEIAAEGALAIARLADWDSKLCRWGTGAARESVAQTFANQALNTFWNFPAKALRLLGNTVRIEHNCFDFGGDNDIAVSDFRELKTESDMWITDPPYADAINYHELSEFQLAWITTFLNRVLGSAPDSRRALAVKGSGYAFKQSMVEGYRQLNQRMPDNGMQVVMFTHQDAGVWADLGLILWAAGLRVTAAWTVGTETASALKQGNYVQGTVLLVLRRRAGHAEAFLDDLDEEIADEVQNQLASMSTLDDDEEPNFGDADYQLAAYAAALRAFTQYEGIPGVNLERELARTGPAPADAPLTRLIESAREIASNYLIPKGLGENPANGRDVWRRLTPEERFYLKGLEVEAHAEYRQGVYQEFARGFGLREYKFLLASGEANRTRLKMPSEFKRRDMRDGFGESLTRHALYGVWRTAETESPDEALTWFASELPDYWNRRKTLIAILRFFARTEGEHWASDADAARVLAGAVDNDHPRGASV